MKRYIPSLEYSQNFFTSKTSISKFIEKISLKETELVLEIGPGKGALTKHLLDNSHKVIAVEMDLNLYHFMREEFDGYENLNLIYEDFLNYKLSPPTEYRIVSNLPFAITSQVIRKVLRSKNSPLRCDFLIQKEAAERLRGMNGKNINTTLVSLMYKPFFEFKVVQGFSKFDFKPIPKVNIVHLSICKKHIADISYKETKLYISFIYYCFRSWKSNMKQILKPYLSYNQMKKVSKKYHIDLNSKPSEVSYEKWLSLFQAINSKNRI